MYPQISAGGSVFQSPNMTLRRDSNGIFALEHASPEGRTRTVWLYSDNPETVMSDRSTEEAKNQSALSRDDGAPASSLIVPSPPLLPASSGSWSSLSSLTSLTSSSPSSFASVSSLASSTNPSLYPVIVQPPAEPDPFSSQLSIPYSVNSLFDGPLTPLPSGSDDDSQPSTKFRRTTSNGKQKQKQKQLLRSHLTGTMSSLTSIPSITDISDNDAHMQSPRKTGHRSHSQACRPNHSSFDELAEALKRLPQGPYQTDPGIPTEQCFNVDDIHRVQLAKMLGGGSQLGTGVQGKGKGAMHNDNMVVSPTRTPGTGPIRKNARKNPPPSPAFVSPSRPRRSARTPAHPQPSAAPKTSSSSSSPQKPPSKCPRAAIGKARGGGWQERMGGLGDYCGAIGRAASVTSQSSHATIATEIVDPDQQFAPRPAVRRELSPTLANCVSTALVSHPTLLLDDCM